MFLLKNLLKNTDYLSNILNLQCFNKLQNDKIRITYEDVHSGCFINIHANVDEQFHLIVRFTVYSGWIFVPKWILSANFVNFGVLISKKLGTIFFFHVISKKIEIQNGGHFLLCFL